MAATQFIAHREQCFKQSYTIRIAGTQNTNSGVMVAGLSIRSLSGIFCKHRIPILFLVVFFQTSNHTSLAYHINVDWRQGCLKRRRHQSRVQANAIPSPAMMSVLRRISPLVLCVGGEVAVASSAESATAEGVVWIDAVVAAGSCN